ncbi:hypothetical protein FHY05_000968 [Sphingomonas sp. BK580]|nr:hypothetical protein [Sphingomonas sp. BK580]
MRTRAAARTSHVNRVAGAIYLVLVAAVSLSIAAGSGWVG